MSDNKKCIFCKRILVENKKIPICSECTNKAGNTVAVVGLAALGGAAKILTGKKKS